MSTLQRFEDLQVWITARELTQNIYMLSIIGGFSRDFALRDQIRRASVSVISNIAEGFESEAQALFITYLGRAKASAGEIRSQLYFALDLDYISREQFQSVIQMVEECSRQLFGFIKYQNLNQTFAG
ncbi:MAG: four helix bundle protein [Anaerolineales bacterium]